MHDVEEAKMLEKEYKYYLDNQKDLLKKYEGKFVVIKGNEIVGDYSSEKEAYEESIKKYELGTFLIQQCLSDKEKPIQSFHSRVQL